MERVSGTPQGGVVSPVLANLFLHYVFDKWMERNFPNYPFARYADDGVVHCPSEAQARDLKQRLERRFRECKLALRPEKTHIVCCNVSKPRGSQVSKKFDFLGYCFRPRLVRTREGSLFVGFTPGISPTSGKNIRRRVRRWRFGLRNSESLKDIAQYINPIVRGWINYYGAYQRSSLGPVLRHINRHLLRQGKPWRGECYEVKLKPLVAIQRVRLPPGKGAARQPEASLA